MLLHINPTRQRGKRTGSLAGASGWYMTFFAAGVISLQIPLKPETLDPLKFKLKRASIGAALGGFPVSRFV